MVSSDLLVRDLARIGWKDFAGGEFLDVEFDVIGKTKIAKNNWFVLLKTVPVLGMAEIEAWNDIYGRFTKRSRSGLFSSGKYFFLILLVDTTEADALEWLSREEMRGFLETPKTITNGGGIAALFARDRNTIFMAENVRLWDVLRATDLVNKTTRALVDYGNSLTPRGAEADLTG